MFARRCVYVRNRPQPFATVHKRSQPSPTGYDKFRKRGHFWKRRVASFRVARVALRDIQTCFVTCRKPFLWQSQYLVTFSDALQFSWQAQHFGRVHRHFAWQAQHFRRVGLPAFLANRIVRAASSGDKVQIPWQARHFVRCDEN